MLGRNSYTAQGLQSGRRTIDAEVAAFDALQPGPERDAFEPHFFN
jgi:hypothetical protein